MSEGTREVIAEGSGAQAAGTQAQTEAVKTYAGAASAATTAAGAPATAVKTYAARAWAAGSAASGLAPVSIRRREPGARDVQIAILYCGVCHSDLHQARVHAKRQAWVGLSGLRLRDHR